MNIDLNIENYDLNDILNLFKLNKNFDNNDLIYAKKLVLKIHPDKSGLDKEYFLFYCKAFKILKQINEFKNKDKKNNLNKYSKIDYLNDLDEQENQHIVDNLMNKKNLDFNKWFNKLFEKLNLNENDNGYGDWLKSNEDLDNTKNLSNLNNMHNFIENKKNAMSQLVKKDDFKSIEYSNTNINNLVNDNNYSSGIFTNLNYEDLKNAHTNTLIPVSYNDYKNKMKFDNVNSYKNYRDNQNLQSLSKEDSESYLNKEHLNNEEIATNIAYKLFNEQEKNIEKNKLWWSNLKLLS